MPRIFLNSNYGDLEIWTMVAPLQNSSSHLKKDKRWFILEPSMNDHSPGTKIQVAPNFMFQCDNSFKKFSQEQKNNKKITQDSFKYIDGSIRETVIEKQEHLKNGP